jgi:pyrimidine-specific ribonucleoside hydrolase
MAAALNEKPFTLLALGPLTNAGSLLTLHPEVVSKIDAIVIVAARRPGQRFTYPGAGGQALGDFNFENDPEAMRVILDSKVPLVFAPWEVSSHVWITPDDLARNATYGGSGMWIYEKSLPWAKMWIDRFKTVGFNPFDTLAVGWVTHPRLMKSMPVSVAIESLADDTADPATDVAPLKPYLLVHEADPADARATYLYEPLPQFSSILHERLSGY